MRRKFLFTACAFLVLANAVAVTPSAAAGDRDDAIRGITRGITSELIGIRRTIHAHPELGMREFKTAALVADYFRKLGLEVRSGIAGTGVLGVLRGGKPRPDRHDAGGHGCAPDHRRDGAPLRLQ